MKPQFHDLNRRVHDQGMDRSVVHEYGTGLDAVRKLIQPRVKTPDRIKDRSAAPFGKGVNGRDEFEVTRDGASSFSKERPQELGPLLQVAPVRLHSGEGEDRPNDDSTLERIRNAT